MRSLFVSYRRQSLRCHSLISLHHAFSATGSGRCGDAFDQLQHLVEHVGDVADDRHVDLDPLGDRRRIDVDVDDLAVGAEEMRRIADHAIVEARADRDQHVAVLHRHVRLDGAVHAEHAGELRVGPGKSAEAHQRVGAREAEEAHEARQLRRRVVQHDAAAGVDHRLLRVEQELDRLLDLPGMSLGDRVVRAQRDGLRIAPLGLRLRHVLRDVDQHRARAGPVAAR